MVIDRNFWKGRRVLITGHTGFKGSWLSLLLQSFGTELCGVALAPATSPAMFTLAQVAENMESHLADVRNLAEIEKIFQQFQPEIVIHMAAQPLVRYSYANPVETYSTNVMGTVHVLEAALHCDAVRAVVNVTTDKCYENKEWLWGYRENEPLGGHDPYSSSKAASELVTSAYRDSFYRAAGKSLASARAGNVIGGGDWAADRLIPDIIRAFQEGRPAQIRHPQAIRPWQHVIEPLCGYLRLAEKLFTDGAEFAEAWNFGPDSADAKPVGWVADKLVTFWGEGPQWVPGPVSPVHEAHYLKLDCAKAGARLGWRPCWTLEQSLGQIVDWHKRHRDGQDMRSVTAGQIALFLKEGATEQ